MMFGYGYGAGPGGPLWLLGGLVVMVGIVLLVVWSLGGAMRTRRDDVRSTPLEILRERYARGEITQEQFEQAKQALERR
ncbi:MAG: SHOCT domain-containing protein [Candidatus Limnocylindrales bacterium]